MIHRYTADTLAVFDLSDVAVQVMIHRYTADTRAVHVWFTQCSYVGDDTHIYCWHTHAVFDLLDVAMQVIIHRYTLDTLMQRLCDLPDVAM